MKLHWPWSQKRFTCTCGKAYWDEAKLAECVWKHARTP